MSENPTATCVQAEVLDGHRWLQQLIGEWDYEGECSMGPEQPAARFQGRETVRGLGDVWVVGEGEGQGPDGSTGRTLITLGYDPRLGCFTGSFAGSMMTHLWRYEGQLDAARRVLTLATEGPDFSGGTSGGGLVRYEDIVTLEADGGRSLTSRMQGADGQWHQLMHSRYRRRG